MIYEGHIKVLDFEDQLQITRNLRDGVGGSKDEGSPRTKKGKRSFAFKLVKYLSLSKLGDIIDGINILFSFSMLLIHIIDSDAPLSESSRNILIVRNCNQNFELAMLVYFMLDFALNLYISDNKFLFLASFSSVIEYLTIFPLLLTHFGLVARSHYINFTRALRYLQTHKMDKIMARHSIESTRSLVRLIMTFFSNFLISSAALYLFESALSSNSVKFVTLA